MARVYRVQLNDTPQTIARVTTGDPARWSTIVGMNPHKPRVVIDGLTTFASLHAGEVLNVPAYVIDGVGVGRVGVGDYALPDVLQLPNGQDAWNKIQQQITSEGDTAEGTVDQNLVVAKNDFLNAINQVSSGQPDIDTGQLALAGLGYVINNRTIGGAVQSVEGLVTAVESGVPTAIVQSVTGLITSSVTVLVAGAVISTGVGAAIIAGIGILSEAISFFTQSPPGEAICGGTVNPPPNYVVGCAYNSNGQTVPLGPTSPNWRKFPVATNTADAWWFSPVDPTNPVVGAITSTFATWAGTGRNSDQWGAILGAHTRPIDAAFYQYHALECEIASANQTIAWNAGSDAVMYAKFQLAFIAAWKSNQEYALNGLKAQPDWLVLLHTARLWNRAHQPGTGLDIAASSSTSDPSNAIAVTADCSTVVGSYEALLINGVINGAASTSDMSIWADVITNSGTTVHVNTGPSKGVTISTNIAHLLLGTNSVNPNAAATATATAPSSTASNVATGAVAVAGTATLATFIYAQIAGLAFTTVASHAWKHAKSWFGSKKTKRRHAREAFENPLDVSTAIQPYRRQYKEPKRRVAFRVDLDVGPSYEAIILMSNDTAVLYRYGKAVVKFKPAKYQFGKIRQQHGELLIYADQVIQSLIG